MLFLLANSPVVVCQIICLFYFLSLWLSQRGVCSLEVTERLYCFHVDSLQIQNSPSQQSWQVFHIIKVKKKNEIENVFAAQTTKPEKIIKVIQSVLCLWWIVRDNQTHHVWKGRPDDDTRSSLGGSVSSFLCIKLFLTCIQLHRLWQE